MADEDDPNVEIDISINDKASPVLSKITAGVGRLGKAVDAASQRFVSMVATTAGFAGLFGLGSAIAGAKRYVDHIDKIANLTGLAADRVAGISEALQVTGVEAGEVEGVLTRMVKRGAQLGEGNKALAKLARGYGVSLKDGPEKTLISMSKLVQDQKLGAGQVSRLLGVSGGTLANMMEALSKGPEELNRMFQEAIDKNSFLGGSTMDQMQSYNEAVNRVGIAWHRLTAGILVAFAPALEKVAAKFEDKIESWSVSAKKFGQFMVDNMDKIIAGARTYAKIMFMNYGLMKLTGQGFAGNAQRIGKFVGSKGSLGSMAAGGLAGIAGGMGSTIKAITSFFTGAAKLWPLINGITKLVGMFTFVGVAVTAFQMLMRNVDGIRSRIGGLLGDIWENIKGLGAALAKIFGSDSPIGQFIRAIGRGFLNVIEFILAGINKLVLAARAFAEGRSMKAIEFETETKRRADLYKSVGVVEATDLQRQLMGFKGKTTDAQRRQFQRLAELTSKQEALPEFAGLSKSAEFLALQKRFGGPMTGEGGTPEMNVYQDFRGSRFDITQEFAEGFDPDRIAVAFANDISSIGERKLQSGFSPLFSVR